MKLGLQLYSVRDDMAKDFKGTMQTVKNMGYEGVELAGLFDYTPGQIHSLVAEIGLNPISAHVPIEQLLTDTEKVLDDYKTIGCRYIAIPWLDEKRRPGNAGFEQTVKDIETIGERAKKQGITLLYHNHNFEFARVDGEYALDLIYKSIPADFLETEIDTCWVNVGGEDPAMYIRKYSGRAPVVHLKDFVMPGKEPEQTERVDKFENRPVGYGYQNIPEIIKASKEAGAGWAIVELDSPGMGKTALECADMSIKYLKSLKL